MNDRDRKILTLLQKDATLSHQQIAEATAMSAATVWRRIQSMEAAGLIDRRVALVNARAAGLKTAALTEVSLASHAPENRAAFERLVASAPEIQECYSVSGSHDYRLLIRVADIEAYERFLMDTLLASPVVTSAETHFALREIKFTTALPV